MGGCGGEGERKEISASMNRVLRDDLLVEILHRVPCKSAFQCKSVCKKWRDLISSKYFLNRFDRHHRSDHEKKIQELGNFSVEYFFPHLFFNPSEYKHQISFDFLPFFNSLPEKTTHFIAGASNDLFLCTEDLQIQDQPVFYVCNPITKHSIALPPPPPRTVLDDISDAFLGSAVFGFSSYNTKFTVVRVLLPVTGKRELFEFQVDVFSSDTGKWARLIAASPKPLMWCSGTPAVYYRGLLHWVSVFGKQIVVYDLIKCAELWMKP
ncbi:putative F-box/kelch-repeat protein At1g15680 isoform X2 [Mercurialis annua]|uniref:putative F-box/kelch-repeat protein At1g15680 isoform X2 n=1 Tax=Mercurialis annua TaxID=3986 RepID=UPI00215E120C|nr:putative F-box/kelch-repeat protein At1g15680 isoform X2 [Mercurialis annua]